MEKAIILDLDDTIFQTKSMDSKVFEPFFSHLVLSLKTKFDAHTMEAIVNDLWQRPFDVVIKKYDIPLGSITGSIKLLESLPLNLKISTFPDYHFIKTMQLPKFLVTTGLAPLQESKIKALKIENDFVKISINDPLREAKTKQDIFKDLIQEFNLIPESTYIIGDNPDSEIKAGNALNMITIQILRNNVVKGDNAAHYISSFSELAGILN